MRTEGEENWRVKNVQIKLTDTDLSASPDIIVFGAVQFIIKILPRNVKC